MSQKDPFLKQNSIIDDMMKKAHKLCLPLITTMEITQSCNYRCHHCYNFDRTESAAPKATEPALTPEEILRIIEELAATGTLYLNFTGGESLLHPHLDDFIAKARTLHMEPRLKSNGSLLTPHRAQRLQSSGLIGIDISLYGFSETSYQKLTGKGEMFQRTLDGISAAVDAKLEVNVSLILHRYNVEEIDSMLSFCRERALPFQFSTEVTERYDGSLGARDFEMTTEQLKGLLASEHQDFFKHSNPEKSVQCSCARTVCGISSTGEVFPCIGAPVPSGNLREKSFQEIWANSTVLNKIRNLKFEDFKSCVTCDHIEFCNRSSGSIYINTKDYTGCEPKVLEEARLRQSLSK